MNEGIGEAQKLLKAGSGGKLRQLAARYRVPLELLKETAKLGRLPTVNFAAGGIATPADAALCMQLGVDGVFVGSGIFKSSDPKRRARAIVDAVAHFNDAKLLAKVSEGLGEAMAGQEISALATRMASRGS
jgi:pyridoxal 5'-phosphate synthase pdxS subunit